MLTDRKGLSLITPPHTYVHLYIYQGGRSGIALNTQYIYHDNRDFQPDPFLDMSWPWDPDLEDV